MTYQYTSDPRVEPSARMAEPAVYTGLSKLFEINSTATVDVSERILRQVSGYVADSALSDGDDDYRELVMKSLRRVNSDIASLIIHLEAHTPDEPKS